MAKQIIIPPKPARPAPAAADLDSWVEGVRSSGPAVSNAAPPPAPEPPQPLRRLNVDITLDLHRRIKVACALRGVNMADEVRRLLEDEFPPL